MKIRNIKGLFKAEAVSKCCGEAAVIHSNDPHSFFMEELSLNVLDIAKNSVKAKATLIQILFEETEDILTVVVKDNGTGIKKCNLKLVTAPFYTTRTTRSVGMGLPLFKKAAEATGGSLVIKSKHFSNFSHNHGTTVKAIFYKKNVNFVPIGNMTETIITLIQGNPEIDFIFKHITPKATVMLDTREFRKVLDGVPLNNYEILGWIKKYLYKQYAIEF